MLSVNLSIFFAYLFYLIFHINKSLMVIRRFKIGIFTYLSKKKSFSNLEGSLILDKTDFPNLGTAYLYK